MRHVDEYRDPAAVRAVVDRIRASLTRPWTLMEVCGGQTHSILKFGMDELLPETVRLIHGPGCPVCVTPVGLIDRALSDIENEQTLQSVRKEIEELCAAFPLVRGEKRPA